MGCWWALERVNVFIDHQSSGESKCYRVASAVKPYMGLTLCRSFITAARNNVPFVKDVDALKIWALDYFHELAKRM